MRIVISLVVGALTAWLLFPTLFKSKHAFIDCVKYCLTPRQPLFKGCFGDDNNNWAEFKLLFWALGSIGMGCGTYGLL